MKTISRICLIVSFLFLTHCGGGGSGSSEEAVSLPLSSDPQVSSDGNGNFMAVWQSGISVVARYYDQGSGGQNFIVGEGEQPALAMSSSGESHVVWQLKDTLSSRYDIHARVYDANAQNWSNNQIFFGLRGSFHNIWPDVAAYGDNAFMAWQQWGGADNSPRANYSIEYLDLIDDNITGPRWRDERDEYISPDFEANKSSIRKPKIALGSNRRAMAAWIDTTGADEGLHVVKFTPLQSAPNLVGYNGQWTDHWLFKIGPRSDVVNATGYDIATQSNGDSFVMWQQGNQVFVNHYDVATNSWALGFGVSNADPNSEAALAIHELGYALVVSHFNNVVSAHHYVPNQSWPTGWQPPITLSSGGTVTGNPDVAIANDGQAMAVWTEDGNITINHFDGMIWTGPTIIGQGQKPQVAMEDGGSCLVVWEQDGFIFDYNCNLPTPRFTYSPTNPRAGDLINFDAGTSTDNGGTITSYEWDFDDDGNYDATGATATHTFTSEGTYTVRLRITNDRGFNNTAVADIPVTSDVLLSINKIGNGTVASSTPGIDCGSDCGETYRIGDSVMLTATPDVGWSFDRWQGDCAAGNGGSQNATITFTINNNFSGSAFLCTAEFLNSNSYELTVNVIGSGTVTSNPAGIDCGSDCVENYPQNTSVSLTAVANNGYRFTGWSGDCSNDGSSPATGVTMDGNKLCYASFAVDNTVNSLAVSVTGGGNVSSDIAGIDCGGMGSDCYEEYPANTDVTLTATASSPYVFESWSGNCIFFSSNPIQAYATVNGDVTCDATFAIPNNPVNLNVSIGGDPGTVHEALAGFACARPTNNGSRTVCNTSYEAGTNLILTVDTASGTDWLQGCDSLITVDLLRRLYHCRLQINTDTQVSVDFR